MKTVVCTRYGSPETLAWADRPDPSPRPGEILVRVRASTVSSADVRVRALHVPRGLRLLARLVLGLRGPRRAVLGTELSGEVVAVGRADA